MNAKGTAATVGVGIAVGFAGEALSGRGLDLGSTWVLIALSLAVTLLLWDTLPRMLVLVWRSLTEDPKESWIRLRHDLEEILRKRATDPIHPPLQRCTLTAALSSLISHLCPLFPPRSASVRTEHSD